MYGLLNIICSRQLNRHKYFYGNNIIVNFYILMIPMMPIFDPKWKLWALHNMYIGKYRWNLHHGQNELVPPPFPLQNLLYRYLNVTVLFSLRLLIRLTR